MAQKRSCAICESEADEFRGGGGGYFHAFICPRCGAFDFDISRPWRRPTSPDEIVRLSGWVHEQNSAGVEYARITPEIVKRVYQMRLPGLRDRAMRTLTYTVAKIGPDLFRQEHEVEDLELRGRT
jgi:hypothetical protein